MADAEFSIIERYFAARARSQAPREDVVVGIGDDAAILQLPAAQQLVMAVDTLVAGVHFPAQASASSIGHKALAVNLSDLAAMGARPLWATLALSLPAVDHAWLEAFASGFFTLAERYQVALVGGDTTRGPLTITVQVCGAITAGRAVLRSGARPGDQIFVTGSLGDAGLALQCLQTAAPSAGQAFEAITQRLHWPEPRLDLGYRLPGLASAAIDISDGLVADLGHILQRSAVGARLWVDRLPRSAAFQTLVNDPLQAAWHALPLTAGDDYELCLTVAPHHSADLRAAAASLSLPLTQVGEIEARPGLRCQDEAGRAYNCPAAGYQHFRS